MTRPRVIRRPASNTPRILYWALLDHFYESDLKATTLTPSKPLPLERSKMNPGFWSDDDARYNPTLQSRIDLLLVSNKSFKKLPFALADLTKNVNAPAYAGNRTKAASGGRDKDTTQSFVASITKIAAMYAAFQLQYDLNVLAQKNPSWTTKALLFDGAWNEWLKTQLDDEAATVTPVLSDPKVEIHGKLVKQNGKKIPLKFADWNPKFPNPRKDGSPNLENMFDVDESKSPLEVSFKKTADPAGSVWAYSKHKIALKKLPFYERMWLMIDKSDNMAAYSCIVDVGYLYIASSLWQSDLYNPVRGGGLWLGASYKKEGPTWRPGPVGIGRQASSPAALVAFMTLIAQNRLVSPHSCSEMKKFLAKNLVKYDPPADLTSLTYSPFQDGLSGDSGNLRLLLDDMYSKLGLANGKYYDCGLIVWEDTVKGKTYHYAVAGSDAGPWELEELIQHLHKCIVDFNK